VTPSPLVRTLVCRTSISCLKNCNGRLIGGGAPTRRKDVRTWSASRARGSTVIRHRPSGPEITRRVYTTNLTGLFRGESCFSADMSSRSGVHLIRRGGGFARCSPSRRTLRYWRDEPFLLPKRKLRTCVARSLYEKNSGWFCRRGEVPQSVVNRPEKHRGGSPIGQFSVCWGGTMRNLTLTSNLGFTWSDVIFIWV